MMTPVEERDPQTFAVIGAAMEVHSQLGHGFLEAVYQEALAKEFSSRRISFEREVELVIAYKGEPLACRYRADFICYGEVNLGQLRVTKISDPQLLEEEVVNIKETIDRLRERIAALRIAIETLREAINEYQESHLSRLSHIATASFSNFTLGGYQRLEIIPGKDPQITTNNNLLIQSK